MLNVIDLRGHRPSTSELRRALPRGGTDIQSVLPVVQPLVDDVRLRGAQAALEYGEKFDRVRPDSVKVPAEVIAAALENLEPQVREALEESISRVRKVHSEQVPVGHTTELSAGGTVTEKFMAVDRVGLYVPGGNAVYPSSVIMNVVPAQEAGASTMVVASPPQEQFGGWPHPTILAACSLLGVDEVWAVGGGQAIALLAYGDDAAQLEPVDMITGPGNIYVTAAKRLVRSVCGIDSEAGPTEIAILADATANPVWVAYDLISQAEHDVMAASVLITDSVELAEAVKKEVEERYSVTLNSERVAEALKGQQSGIVLVDDLGVCRRAPGDPHGKRPRGRRAHSPRGSHLRRRVLPGPAGRLLRGLQPRAAHLGLGPLQLGAVHAHLPARGQPHRVRRGGAEGDLRHRHRAGRRRAAARPRRGHQGPLRGPLR